MVRQPVLVVLGFVALSALFCTSNAAALEPHLGAQVGMSLSRVYWSFLDEDEDVSDVYRKGVSGGVSLSLGFPGQEVFSLESGLYFQMRGGTKEKTRSECDVQGSCTYREEEFLRYRFAYLSVPLLGKVRLGHGALRPYLKAGPEVSMLLSAEAEEFSIVSLSPLTEEWVTSDVKDNMTLLDYGLFVGGGLEFPVAGLKGYVEASYLHGLRDVLEPEDAVAETDLRNRVIGVNVGVRF
jgi:hypothetical protein